MSGERPPLDVRPLPGAFGGVEVLGVEPSVEEDAALGARLRRLLADHAVVCIRQARPLTDDEARAIAAMIGPIKDPIGRTRDGDVLRYSDDRQIIDAGFVMTDELRAQLGDVNFGGLDEQRPGLFETFHTDDTYTEDPAVATVLHARELPSGPGGATQFIDMRATFQILDPQVRDRLVGRECAYRYNNGGVFPPRVAAEGEGEALVDVRHPIVRVHPIAGTISIFIDLDRATHIVDVPVEEGRAQLQAIQDLAEKHAPRYAHAWRPHDVLMWDNASVQHKASGDFPVGEPRRFWRFMIAGPKPEAARE